MNENTRLARRYHWFSEKPVELNLRHLKSRVPVELIGGVRFPPIGELPYLLTLGPHSFYWFRLELEKGPAV